MKGLFVHLCILLSLVYNHTTYAASLQHKIKSLKETMDQYNQMRNNPSALVNLMDENDKLDYNGILIKGKITQLPEIVLNQDGKYQLSDNENKIIFDEQNWNNQKIIVNDFSLNFSKVTNVKQLIEALSQILSEKKKKKLASENMLFKEIFMPVSYAEGSVLNSTNMLIAAAVIGTIGIGYLIYKNNKNDKKSKSTTQVVKGDDQKTDQESTVSPEPSGDCRSIPNPSKRYDLSGRFVWKPVSENDHRLVVLFPKGTSAGSCVIYDSNNNKIEAGRFDRLYEDGRPYWRFSKSGSSYPQNIKVCAGSGDGKTEGSNPNCDHKWDFTNNQACPEGLYNCDCVGDCAATKPCN